MFNARYANLLSLPLVAAGIIACGSGPTEPSLSPGRITGCSIELKGITLRGTSTNETFACNSQGITRTSSTGAFGTEVDVTQVYGSLDPVKGASTVTCSGDRLICARPYPRADPIFNQVDSTVLIIDTVRCEIRIQGIHRISDLRQSDQNNMQNGYTTRSNFWIYLDHIPFNRSSATTQTVEIDGNELRSRIDVGYFSKVDVTSYSFINDFGSRTTSSEADTIGAVAPGAYLKITFTYR
jgi:hypothetical protein